MIAGLEMGLFYFVLLILCCIVLLDILKLIDYAKGFGLIVTAFIYPHLAMLFYLMFRIGWDEGRWLSLILLMSALGVCLVYYLIRLHILTFRGNKSGSLRVNILYGGKLLIIYSIWGLIFQGIWYLVLTKPVWRFCSETDGIWVFWTDLAVSFILIAGIMINGVLRIICTSRQLGITKRLLAVFLIWIPLLNLYILWYLCYKAKEEYDYECCRHEIREQRTVSELCATRYPILLLHGVGFRDHRLFNYWGRIPKELVHNGAVVYYGHQEGWGVTEDNGQIIKEKIEEIIEENHCDKVNIIAHSKGGLDARYTIGELKMADKVASVTTICTPHRGSALVPFLRKMPEGLYRFICNCIDSVFRAYGDTRPDVYRSGLQLDPEFCKEFNNKYPNVPGIYYQSYASSMKHWYSEPLLSVPYLILKKLAGPVNDGLVSEDSAKWGDFKGTFYTGGWRGISHADMIDLHREDYKGFDVIEAYIKIVNDLKIMGL